MFMCISIPKSKVTIIDNLSVIDVYLSELNGFGMNDAQNMCSILIS